MANFTHLHVHSEFSLLDGLSSVNQIVEKAAELKMKSIALTDHGNMFGAYKFFQAAQKVGVKPIIGVEIYVAPRSRFDKIPKIDDKPYHLILLAKNEIGYKNLIKLVSLANSEGYYYKPRVDKELLAKYSEGIVASSACLAGEIPRHLYADRYEEAKKSVEKYIEIFGKENFCLEIQVMNHKDQNKVNKSMYKLAKDMDLTVVATADSHYPSKEDAFAQDVLLAVNTKQSVDDENRLSMIEYPDFYIWSEDEMLKRFEGMEDAVYNTAKIADMCNFQFDAKDWILPEPHVPSEMKGKEEKYLIEITYKRIKDRLSRDLTTDEKERLDYELKVINEKGFSKYMLMVTEFTDWMIERHVPFTTRGSAAGSFVAYGLGIVNANPLNFNLAFERFLNPMRPKAPDIDLDVASNVRDDLVKYTIETFGEENVAHIITFGRMQARGSIRDAGRVLGMPLDFVDKIAKLIPPSGQGLAKVTIKRAIDEVMELRQLIDTEPEVKKLIDTAKKIEGKAKSVGLHACGILVTPTPITDYVPVTIDKDTGRMVTQFGMEDLEEMKLIKVDFLGLKNLETIAESIRLVKTTRNEDIDLENLTYDDKEVYKNINKLDTLGVFQIESDVMKQTIRTIKPETIFDLSAVNALVRPGPNQFQHEYAARKSGKKKIEYLDPRMEKFLKLSNGVLVYQEDIIRAVIELAGMDWGESDKIRKATGKKKPDVLFEMKDELISRFIEHGMSEKNAKTLFEQFIPFTNYAFNQAHAASYALIIYYTAWLKTHYPIEFIAALLKTEIDDKDKVTKVLDECYRKGIKILPPSINYSDVDFKIENNNSIRIGLASIKGVNHKTIENLVNNREVKGIKYTSLDQVLDLANLDDVTVKSMELLIRVGALDEFGDRNAILNILPIAYKKAKERKEKMLIGQSSLFGKSSNNQTIEVTPIPEGIITSQAEKIRYEKDLIGIYITDHPLKDATRYLDKFDIKSTASIKSELIGQLINIVGSVQKIKKIVTKSGDSMAFVKLEDLDGFAEIVIFPKLYELYKEILKEGKMLIVKGRINERNDELTIIADKLVELTNEKLDKIKSEYVEEPEPKEKVQSESEKFVGIKCYTIGENKVKFCISQNASSDVLDKLKKLIKENPGDSKVILEFLNGKGSIEKEIKGGIKMGDWVGNFEK